MNVNTRAPKWIITRVMDDPISKYEYFDPSEMRLKKKPSLGIFLGCDDGNPWGSSSIASSGSHLYEVDKEYIYHKVLHTVIERAVDTQQC
jgi:hypothetical protein